MACAHKKNTSTMAAAYLGSPYTLSPIIFTMNEIYVKPMIWTFRACLGDQTISKKPSNILFSRRDMHFQFTTGLLAKFGHGC
jgi:hypothetical protein